MSTPVFRFQFEPHVDFTEAELTLHLAVVAAEGLHGEARVRMDVSYHADEPRRSITVDGATPAGEAVASIFTGYLTREIGADAFSVRRVQDGSGVATAERACRTEGTVHG